MRLIVELLRSSASQLQRECSSNVCEQKASDSRALAPSCSSPSACDLSCAIDAQYASCWFVELAFVAHQTRPSQLMAQQQHCLSAVQLTFPLSTAFAGRYQSQRKIMDARYEPILLCRDTHNSNRTVAAKLISLDRYRQRALTHPNTADNPHGEMQVIRLLRTAPSHPSVLQYDGIYDEEEADVLILVMELCTGGDLQVALSRTCHQRFEEIQALRFFRQFVGAVHFLHLLGIAHRDLSLENILLTENGVCKICDFGLSTSAKEVCAGAVGKKSYMAPEVVSGAVCDPISADTWSLGIILFVMITGCRLCTLAEADNIDILILERFDMERLLELRGIARMVSPRTANLLALLLRVAPDERVRLDSIMTKEEFSWINMV